jgi:trimeric autotransporter adhesin
MMAATGTRPSAIGRSSTAIGAAALGNSTAGSNTALGFAAGSGVTSANNVICIGAGFPGANVDNSCFIGNIFNQSSPSGTAVFVNGDGKLGTSTSSKRFKDDIKPMEKASEALLALQSVTFRYKREFDPTGTAQFGLVAEEVEKVNSDQVVHDKDGKPYSVRYDQVNAMLLNEFLKEHKKVEQQEIKIEKQEATIAELRSAVAQQNGMEILTAQLREQAAQIQKFR